MISALIYHATNVPLSLVLLSLLLRFLTPTEYAYWIIFTTIAGFGIQLQTAIQTVVVREIAREHHGYGIGASFRRAKRTSGILGLFAAGPVLAGGFIYLDLVGAGWVILFAWLLFVASYALSFWGGALYALALGTDGLAFVSKLNIVTRAAYVAGAAVALWHGLSLAGVTGAFLLSTIVSVAAIWLGVRRIPLAPPDPAFGPGPIWQYAIFALMSFALYNGALLVAFRISSKEEMAGLGLAVQIATLLLGASTIPAQGKLGQLSKALNEGRTTDTRKVLASGLGWGAAVFGVGYAGVVLSGPALLREIGAGTTLPGTGHLVLIGAAFFVELLIYLLCLFMISARQFRFVPVYLAHAMVGLVGGVAVALLTGDTVWFAAVPCTIQALICLPFVAAITRTELGRAHLPVVRAPGPNCGATVERGPS